jgi:hypothetical protein
MLACSAYGFLHEVVCLDPIIFILLTEMFFRKSSYACELGCSEAMNKERMVKEHAANLKTATSVNPTPQQRYTMFFQFNTCHLCVV